MTTSTLQNRLPGHPQVSSALKRAVAADYERFATDGLPESLESYLRERYAICVEAEYAGIPLKNPWGKASGQLSMTSQQVAEDVAAGLGFVVLKTVIAEDSSGARSMDAWAVRESRMSVEAITGQSGERGWTVTWKGRGWWQSLEDYCDLVRASQAAARGSGTLVVPSCKFHLPGPEETEWKIEEYTHTTRRIFDAWSHGAQAGIPMPLEKDFSPTLAGSDVAAATTRVLEWFAAVPGLIRGAVESDKRGSLRVALKLMNALFSDEFQAETLAAVHNPAAQRADSFVYANRLFDPHRQVAYGGPDLSDRNLRTMALFQETLGSNLHPHERLPWSATGNIHSGKLALEYALRGASSFQLHTLFQLPAKEYRMRNGTKTQKALHELYFHPEHGFIVWMHHIAAAFDLPNQPIEFRNLVGKGADWARR